MLRRSLLCCLAFAGLLAFSVHAQSKTPNNSQIDMPRVAASPQKVVSFAWADPTGVYLGAPQWADDWVKKNAVKFPTILFSQTPMPGEENYLVVLSTSTTVLSGFQPVTKMNTTTSTTDISGDGTATDSYGSRWSYTFQGSASTTTTTMTTQNIPYTLETRTLWASAYGGPSNLLIARNSEWTAVQRGGDPTQGIVTDLGGLVRRIRMKTRLLDGVVKDIAKLPQYGPSSRTTFVSSRPPPHQAPATALAKIAPPNNWREDERHAWEMYNALPEDDKKYVRDFCSANPTARTLLPRTETGDASPRAHTFFCASWLNGKVKMLASGNSK
jgi:hypothetical protein